MTKPPIILLTFANAHEGPEGNLRNLAREESEIHRALLPAERNGLCQLLVRENVTLDDITAIFSDPEYKDRIAIFHFGGHADSYSLLLETPFRQLQKIYAQGFSEYLKEQQSLQLVFLNGCLTTRQADMLHRQDIPAVISTLSEVGDKIAMQIAVHFYRSLGGGNPIDRSFRESIALIKSFSPEDAKRSLGVRNKEDKENWFPPWKISFSKSGKAGGNWNLPQAAGNLLFDLPLAKGLPLPAHPFPGHLPYPSDRALVFWGRDRDIRGLYQLLHSENPAQVIILSGDSGVGKSSLLLAGLMPRIKGKFQLHYFEKLPKAINGKEQEGSKALFIFDQVHGPSNQFLEMLRQTLKIQVGNHGLLSIRSAYLKTWEKALEAIGISYQVYTLLPPGPDATEEIIAGISSFSSASELYRIDVKPDLGPRLASLLAQDAGSPILPILQYILSHLYKMAGEGGRAGVIDWDLYQKFSREKPWEYFLQHRLAVIDEEAAHSGLLLNILQRVLKQPAGEVKLNTLSKDYEHSEENIQLYIDRLIDQRLITSAYSSEKEGTVIRLGHSLLTVPVLNAINQSQRPVQEAARTLQYQLSQNGTLSAQQLKLLEQNLALLPKLSGEELNFLDENRSLIKIRNKRRQAIKWIKISGTALLLAAGFLFNNPYLLIYLILLLLVYPRN